MIDRRSAMWQAIMHATIVHEKNGQESCGVIVNWRGDAGRDIFVPVRNSAPQPDKWFQMEPFAIREAVEGQLRHPVGEVDLVSIVHSHPGGKVGPSKTDVRHFPRWMWDGNPGVSPRGWVITVDEANVVRRKNGFRDIQLVDPIAGSVVAYNHTGPLMEMKGRF